MFLILPYMKVEALLQLPTMPQAPGYECDSRSLSPWGSHSLPVPRSLREREEAYFGTKTLDTDCHDIALPLNRFPFCCFQFEKRYQCTSHTILDIPLAARVSYALRHEFYTKLNLNINKLNAH